MDRFDFLQVIFNKLLPLNTDLLHLVELSDFNFGFFLLVEDPFSCSLNLLPDLLFHEDSAELLLRFYVNCLHQVLALDLLVQLPFKHLVYPLLHLG